MTQLTVLSSRTVGEYIFIVLSHLVCSNLLEQLLQCNIPVKPSSLGLFFFPLKKKIIYLFIYDCAGSSLLCGLFL